MAAFTKAIVTTRAQKSNEFALILTRLLWEGKTSDLQGNVPSSYRNSTHLLPCTSSDMRYNLNSGSEHNDNLIILVINYGLLFVERTHSWNGIQVWHLLGNFHLPQRASGCVHVLEKILKLNMSFPHENQFKDITQVRLMRASDRPLGQSPWIITILWRMPKKANAWANPAMKQWHGSQKCCVASR